MPEIARRGTFKFRAANGAEAERLLSKMQMYCAWPSIDQRLFAQTHTVQATGARTQRDVSHASLLISRAEEFFLECMSQLTRPNNGVSRGGAMGK